MFFSTASFSYTMSQGDEFQDRGFLLLKGFVSKDEPGTYSGAIQPLEMLEGSMLACNVPNRSHAHPKKKHAHLFFTFFTFDTYLYYLDHP